MPECGVHFVRLTYNRGTAGVMARPVCLYTTRNYKQEAAPVQAMGEPGWSETGFTDEEITNDSSNQAVETALRLLYDHRLDDAEQMLLCGLLKPMYAVTKVKALCALAEICYRKSRTNTTSHPMECHWLVLHALALLNKSIEECERHSGQTDSHENCNWFKEQLEILAKKVCRFEEMINHLLYMYVKSNEQSDLFSYRLTPISHTPAYSGNFPLTPTAIYRQDIYRGNLFTSTTTFHAGADDSWQSCVELLSSFQEYCRRRVRGGHSEDILRDLFGKGTDDTFRDSNNCVIYTDKVSHHGHIQTQKGLANEICDNLPETITVTHNSSVATDNMDYVQTLWTNAVNSNITDVNKNPPLTENDKNNANLNLYTETKTNSKNNTAVVSPLSEKYLKCILCGILLKLSQKIRLDGELEEAGAIVSLILTFLEGVDGKNRRQIMLHASVAKENSEILACLGENDKSMEWLQIAMRLYKQSDQQGVVPEIASVMIELGNAYMVKFSRCNESRSVYDCVIEVMADSLDNDMGINVEMPKSSKINKKICGTVNLDWLNKAIECYCSAVISLGQKPIDLETVKIYSKAAVKLADCYFISANFVDALKHYEEALPLFREIAGSDATKTQAHILCMVAANSFMLGLYPKASSSFECAFRLVRHASDEEERFLQAMVLSLLGLSLYKLTLYQKCITWCFQAFEIYADLFSDCFSLLSVQKLWLIGQTIYMLGVSYNNLKLFDRAIHYLMIGREILSTAANVNYRQQLRILQILGDSYFAKTDYTTALMYYHEALELNDRLTYESNGYGFRKSEDMTVYGDLLSSSADAHLNLKDYSTACDYFQKASMMQSSVTDHVKADLADTLHSLGEINATAGELDKAIGSYVDCLEIQDELADSDVSQTCTKLATLCYIKALHSDNEDTYVDMLIATEMNFTRALERHPKPSCYVRYVNFLQNEGNHSDAVVYLMDLCEADASNLDSVTYTGIEKCFLPSILQYHFETVNDVMLPLRSYVLYLLITSHLYLNHTKVAESALLQLLETAIFEVNRESFLLLGYAQMHLSLFKEAAISFHRCMLFSECSRTHDVFYICVCVWFLEELHSLIHLFMCYFAKCIYMS